MADAGRPVSRIGPYEVLGLLGQGGMGKVFRARDPRLHRNVAVKLLPPSVALDEGQLARFEREARILASLDHQHIAGGLPARVPRDRLPILESIDRPRRCRWRSTRWMRGWNLPRSSACPRTTPSRPSFAARSRPAVSSVHRPTTRVAALCADSRKDVRRRVDSQPVVHLQDDSGTNPGLESLELHTRTQVCAPPRRRPGP